MHSRHRSASYVPGYTRDVRNMYWEYRNHGGDSTHDCYQKLGISTEKIQVNRIIRTTTIRFADEAPSISNFHVIEHPFVGCRVENSSKMILESTMVTGVTLFSKIKVDAPAFRYFLHLNFRHDKFPWTKRTKKGIKIRLASVFLSSLLHDRSLFYSGEWKSLLLAGHLVHADRFVSLAGGQAEIAPGANPGSKIRGFGSGKHLDEVHQSRARASLRAGTSRLTEDGAEREAKTAK